VALLLGQRVGALALKEFRHGLVELVLLFRRLEGAGDEAAFGVLDELDDLAAQGPRAEGLQAAAKLSQVAADVRVLRAERREVAEDVFVNDGGQAVEFQERVLERGGCGQDFLAAFECPSDILPHLVALPVAVPQLMSLVDDAEVPLDGVNLRSMTTGEVQRGDRDCVGVEGVGIPGCLSISIGLGIEDHSREMELLLQFQRPLLADGGGADNQLLAPTLCPVLAEHQPRLDGLAQPHLVCQQNALRDRRADSEEGGLDLVGVQVNTGVKERPGQTLDAAAATARQLVGEVSGVVRRAHGPCPLGVGISFSAPAG